MSSIYLASRRSNPRMAMSDRDVLGCRVRESSPSQGTCSCTCAAAAVVTLAWTWTWTGHPLHVPGRGARRPAAPRGAPRARSLPRRLALPVRGRARQRYTQARPAAGHDHARGKSHGLVVCAALLLLFRKNYRRWHQKLQPGYSLAAAHTVTHTLSPLPMQQHACMPQCL
jgi:hypothetical protein